MHKLIDMPEWEADPIDVWASVSLDDGNVRLFCFDDLPDEVRRGLVGLGLRWKRAEECFVGKFSAELLLAFQRWGVEIQDDEPDLVALAEERASRFEDYADSAEQRADAAYRQSDPLADILPLGQPVLVGHGSERGHRKALANAHASMQKSIEERQKAKYWRARAEAAIKRAQRRYERPALSNRIEVIERDLRKWQREAETAKGQQLTIAQIQIGFLTQRRDYAQALLAALPDSAEPEQGGMVRNYDGGWHYVERVNAKSITVRGWLEPRLTHRLNHKYVEAVLSKSEAEELAAAGRIHGQGQATRSSTSCWRWLGLGRDPHRPSVPNPFASVQITC